MSYLKTPDGDNVSKLNRTKRLVISGEPKVYPVYRIRLDALYYNDRNDRIATWINQYRMENGELPSIDNDRIRYNDLIHEFIKKSDSDKFGVTLESIRKLGQNEPGVVLNDGRIIDGNRRFTCLRELSEKDPTQAYFDAVILDEGFQASDRRIKALELNLQMGVDKPVDYDPVERMVSVYRIVDVDKMFTLQEFANETNMNEKDATLLLTKARLMAEFLDFIGCPEMFFLARELKLDGPLQEAVNLLKKCQVGEQKDRMKNAIFIDLIAEPEGDMSRYLRKYTKIIGSDQEDKFLEEQEDIGIEVLERIKEQISVGSEPGSLSATLAGIKAVRADPEIKAALCRNMETAVLRVESKSVKDAPLRFAMKGLESLQEVDKALANKLPKESADKLNDTLDAIQKVIEEIRESMRN